jgi:hypothetical protein
LFDPAKIIYCQGGGLAEDRVQQLIRETVERAGAEALELPDKPELRRRLLAFATGVSSAPNAHAQKVAEVAAG